MLSLQLLGFLGGGMYFVTQTNARILLIDAKTTNTYTSDTAAANNRLMEERFQHMRDEFTHKLAGVRRDLARLDTEMAKKPPAWMIEKVEKLEREFRENQNRRAMPMSPSQ